MTVIIAGTLRLAPEKLGGLRPHMAAMMAASQAEDGCAAYAFSEDVAEPGLIRLFEAWRDQAALDAHVQAPHMAAWRAASASFGLSDRRLFAYEVASERPL
jgi:quinol monooxygenase YgiN